MRLRTPAIGAHACDMSFDPNSETRVERMVFELVHRGRNRVSSTAWFILDAALTTGLLAIGLTFIGDNVSLSQHQTAASVRVLRTNYDQNPATANVVYVTGPTGRRVLIEDLATRPKQGETIHVLYDPSNAGRLVQQGVRIWKPRDFVPLVGAILGGFVTLAEWRNMRRVFRTRRRHRG